MLGADILVKMLENYGVEHVFGVPGDTNVPLYTALQRSGGVAILTHEKTGRSIKVFSDEPGVQVYTGNNLNKTHKKNSGICIETQHFPDSPNNTSFPTTLLTPNNPFESNTTIKIL